MRGMSRHLRSRDLMLLSDGELPPAADAVARKHLDGCDACRSEYCRWVRERDALARLREAALPPDERDRLRSRLSGVEQLPADDHTRGRLQMRRKVLALAGGAALLTGFLLCLRWPAPHRTVPGAHAPIERGGGASEMAPTANGVAAARPAPNRLVSPLESSPLLPGRRPRGKSHPRQGSSVSPSPSLDRGAPPQTIAVASEVRGTPTITRAGLVQRAMPGMPISRGDDLRVADTDRVQMRFGDGAQIVVNSDSRVRIVSSASAVPESEPSVRVDLLVGYVWAWSPGDGGEVQVQTESGVVRVHHGEALVRTHGPCDLEGLRDGRSVEVASLRGQVSFRGRGGHVTRVPAGLALLLGTAQDATANPPQRFSRILMRSRAWDRHSDEWSLPPLKRSDLLAMIAAPRVGLGMVVAPSIDVPDGLAVASLDKESLASRVGIEVGDILLAVAGRSVASLADLEAAQLLLPHTRDPEVRLRRGGQEMVLELHATPPPKESARFSQGLTEIAREAAIGNTSAARVMARRLVADSPDSSWGWYDVGLLEEYEGDPLEAVIACKRAAQLAPDEPMMQLALGRAYANNGNLVRSEDAFRRAAELGAGASAVFWLGYTYLLDGHTKEALEEAARLASLSTPSGPQYAATLRALDAYLEGDFTRALAEVGPALAAKGSPPEARCCAAAANLSLRRVEAARTVLAPAIKAYPDCAKAVNLMGVTYFSEKRWGEARAWFERGAKLRPMRDISICNLATIQVETRDLAGAATTYRDALRGSPSLVVARLGLGFALDRAGHWEEAATEYARVLDLDPSNDQALAWAVALHRAHGNGELASRLELRYGLASAGAPSSR